MKKERGPSHPERGVTLVEISIAIVIAALLVTLAAPMIGGITQAALRTSASKISGMIKGTYDHAVLSGHTCRVVFDFEKSTVTAEETSDAVGLVIEGDPESEDKDDDDDKDSKKEEASGNDAMLLAIAKRYVDRPSQKRKKPTFTRIQGTSVYELDEQVKITELISEHLKNPAKSGREAIYLFPMGYSEHAMLYLEDPGGRVFSVEVEPLNGRTKISDKRARYEDGK